MTIYTKTPRGAGEIANRSGAIGQRARRVLILIDGLRSHEALRTLSGDGELDASLAQLRDAGFITAARETGATARDASAPPASHSEDASQNLQKARNFMINTLRAFHGNYSKLGLIKRIEGSQQRADLEALFDEWRASITENRTGLKRVDELTSQLRAVM
ncbi:hypothetical protein [Thauera linaloolentis]|uniref:Uncharacterized protein n=1 Tax=Thauera linaloolentis (strain DSM 12138 / JCM 21573 / CCUG 41526 / CIP 105981 / IAM 15112 / NBRC 102519 / 47Lol) TaxID=1123367 RepID=N6Z6X6_THAL4|nr:hypothetical protein [Thauera linaloolentis]ENO90307.1 hypothetical protein C666_02545 [Thauera linaloolentis 47Lol = DSM 12138]MCM8566204.1 hypothetical protein [Thauera linaloolentis]